MPERKGSGAKCFNGPPGVPEDLLPEGERLPGEEPELPESTEERRGAD